MKIIVAFLLFTCISFAQNDYISVDDPVYNFLERMEVLHIIHGYNSFELPKSRKDIAKYLKQVIASESKLDVTDSKILQDLEVQFEFELYGTLQNSQAIIGHGNYDLFSQNDKYFLAYTDSNKTDIFINLLGEGEGLFLNDFQNHNNLSASLGVIGGEISGSFLNHFGFFLSGTDGNVFGNKLVADSLREDIRQNYKFNERPTAAFFDQTLGYLTADFDMLRIKFGQDKLRIGYGPMKSIIDDNSPPFTYLGFDISYSFFTFSYFHGQLLGNETLTNDSVAGSTYNVEQKYIGYHRIGFDLSDVLNVGAGEMIIYGDRGIDLSYVNPFAFYKSVSTADQDRDNSLLFFDVNDKSIKGMKIYSTLLIDDVDFSKLGTGWYANEFLWDVGIFSSNLYNILPADVTIEYTRVDPYVHTNRRNNNNFTNFGYDMGSGLQPNSELFLGEINYRFNYRTNLDVSFKYILHGANPVLIDGTIINVGGDESLGHRSFDALGARILAGDLEYSRITTASLTYEPVKQYIFSLKLVYLNESLENSVFENQLQTFINLSVKL
jgi:hypothetical protein